MLWCRPMPNLSQELFPGGEKAGWRLKAVQRAVEAKDVIARRQDAGAVVRYRGMSQLRLNIEHDRFAQSDIATAEIGAACSIRFSGIPCSR